VSTFDYTPFAPPTAERIRATASRIRERVKCTLADLIAIGIGLLDVKDALPHGQFGPWLSAEFGWTDRTARNFMAVAEHFGPKSEMISDLAIAPTAAYLLAGPSVPFEARQVAIDRAASGETITAAVAKEIMGAARKKNLANASHTANANLEGKLAKLLARFRERLNPRDLGAFANRLRAFADELDCVKKSQRRRS